MGGDCRVHEDLYNEDCYVHGCGTGSPCANECCDHGWCTTPGADGCDSASGSFNGYTGSCKGSYACCSEDDDGSAGGEGYPACCVEHSYWADGEVTGTTCHGRRSPWDAATMSDLCTAGYSDAGEWAPPFRDCSQAAIDADAGCGTADWETCAVCAEYGIPTGMYFANVGYASCPDWVVNAAYEEAENGGQCVEGLGGVHATSDECFDCRFCFDCEAYGTCDLPVEEKCWGQGAYPACEALWQQCDWNYTNNACREWGYPKGCLLYTSPSPRDRQKSRMPSSA